MATKPLTKYDPSMCDKMVEMGKLGKSQKMMWSELGISKSTANAYAKKHPEFAEALDLALVHSQAFWEQQILMNLDNKQFNSRLAEIALRGQFQDTYRETRDTKVEAKVDVVVDFGAEVSKLIESLKEAK